MRSPWLRLPLALLCLAPVFAAQAAVWGLAPRFGKVPVAILSLAIAGLLGAAVYTLYVRSVEQRQVTELGRDGAGQEFVAGIALGAGVFAAVVGLLALFGAYRVSGVRGDLSIMVIPLCVSFAAAVIEEIVFRGVIFRLLEASLGTWIALGISAALFGFAHIAGPNATVFAAIAIALEAGVMLGAAYVLTRRLWLAIGIHGAWNFTQGGIFGLPISGIPMNGLLVGNLAGPEWLSGGAFGAEASVVAIVLATTLGGALLTVAHRRGRFMAPSWRRRDAAAPSGPA